MFDGFKEHKKASQSAAEWSEGGSVVESLLKDSLRFWRLGGLVG